MKGFLDIETSGFSITKNAVCEIALIAVNDNYEVVDTFHSLILPYKREDSDELCSYKDDAMAVNGLTVEQIIKEGNDVEVVINGLFQFIVKHNIQTIVGHNSNAFDNTRVDYLLNRFTDFTIGHLRKLDTMILAKDKLQLPSYSLHNLCTHFGIVNTKVHSAEGDALATLELYKRLI